MVVFTAHPFQPGAVAPRVFALAWCVIPTGAWLKQVYSHSLPPPDVELCICAMLDCGGDELVSIADTKAAMVCALAT